MPINPLYAHAYVPYQSFTTTFPIREALMKGTIFPELSNVYNPHEDPWKEEK
ncbi:spore coat associated protein CotJA [Alkaliphilus sp. B6464]|uniref:spore coat associated protein CotJA n=1 Tax=Alkaliphilus sp. B6464 TaxID=2731219 RepID=UPI0020122E2E|nr:spore coat associated protein CotJA [Alkaliphilus sp. B6464]